MLTHSPSLRLTPHASPLTRYLERRLAQLLERAGARPDGGRPWDPRIVDPAFYRRLFADGTVGAGEGYVDGQWECDAIDELTCRLLRAGIDDEWRFTLPAAVRALAARLVNRQSRPRARRSVVAHYDRGDDLYRAMLGPTMVYSCGYWARARDLDEAQEAKLDLVCRKLGISAGQRVLDIGCGWGAFARHAAQRYGARVLGVTLSPSQAAHARALCVGLPVEIRIQDYRDLGERFDRVVSIGMFEHVGARNYRAFFETVRRCLHPDGLCLLHTIGSLTSSGTTDPWLDKHIFPGSQLPSAAQITRAMEGLFVLEDWHSFGPYYDRTLLAWHENFEAAWPSLRSRYDERFRRMWRYYLLTCAGSFRARRNQLWQLVLSPRGVPGGYSRPT